MDITLEKKKVGSFIIFTLKEGGGAGIFVEVVEGHQWVVSFIAQVFWFVVQCPCAEILNQKFSIN